MSKLIIIAVLLAIVISLGSAMIHMLRGTDPQRTARALTYRIGMSVALFIVLLVCLKLGIIEPHGTTPVR